MIRTIPVVPTLLVLAAVAVMVRLGFWQLDRLHQKEALIAQGRHALTASAEAPWPRSAADTERVLYRHATVDCVRVLERSAQAGENLQGTAGWAHVARCVLADGGEARLVLGWSLTPAEPAWAGGKVGGIIAPGPRLVVTTPVDGLERNATPDPASLPNNHLSYAIQWFLFAATALVIYALALRKRWKSQALD